MGRPGGLAKAHRRTLDRLKAVHGIDRFYLVGGSAIAFHLNHRVSVDLDLFSLDSDVDLQAMARAVHAAIPEMEILERSDATLKLYVDGVPVDLVAYPYPPISTPLAGPSGIPIAALLDLGAMKFAAIARRGIRRDFWDLYEIVNSGIALEEIRKAYVNGFKASEGGLYHVMRSLTWFEDAERDPKFPAGLTKKHWEEIKRFFNEEAPRLLVASSK